MVMNKKNRGWLLLISILAIIGFLIILSISEISETPEPEPPLVKIIEDEAVLFPWIDFNVYEKDIHWDLFKPGAYMGKTFQVFMRANTPIQILFGCGTMEYPIGFDPVANEIIWDVDDFGACLTDKIRLHSILNKEENSSVGDEIEEYLWWYEALERPDPHLIGPDELAMVPPYGDPDWHPAPRLNGMAWIYPDSDELHEGWWVQFFEHLKVDLCDSEGKYYKEIHLTVAPDP